MKKDWIGHVDSVTMSDDGEIMFQVDIEHGNELADFDLHKKFEDLVLELNPGTLFSNGDKVKVSGRFSKGDMKGDNECLDGTGLSISDSPELDGRTLEFKFTDIQKM